MTVSLKAHPHYCYEVSNSLPIQRSQPRLLIHKEDSNITYKSSLLSLTDLDIFCEITYFVITPSADSKSEVCYALHQQHTCGDRKQNSALIHRGIAYLAFNISFTTYFHSLCESTSIHKDFVPHTVGNPRKRSERPRVRNPFTRALDASLSHNRREVTEGIATHREQARIVFRLSEHQESAIISMRRDIQYLQEWATAQVWKETSLELIYIRFSCPQGEGTYLLIGKF
ncbi:hypothetical protein Tco_1048070 [Tanacetum coccineum]